MSPSPVLRSCAALLVAAACAASGGRVVQLQSEAYTCGAAAGLGCGLALDPVLRSIDELEGVEASSVSWDGRTFRIELDPGADSRRVAEEATALLEGGSCCPLGPGEAAGGARPGEWFDAEQVVALSRYEAAVLAARFATRVLAEVPLEADAAERLLVVLREALQRAFEQAHARGGGLGRLREQLPEGWPRLEARVRELAGEEQAAAILAALERELGE
jgi:hypothetical protein